MNFRDEDDVGYYFLVIAGVGILVMAVTGLGAALYSGDWRPLLLCTPLWLLR